MTQQLVHAGGRWRCLTYMIQRAQLNLALLEQLDLVGRTAELALVRYTRLELGQRLQQLEQLDPGTKWRWACRSGRRRQWLEAKSRSRTRPE